jgi:hypothetical protein
MFVKGSLVQANTAKLYERSFSQTKAAQNARASKKTKGYRQVQKGDVLTVAE